MFRKRRSYYVISKKNLLLTSVIFIITLASAFIFVNNVNKKPKSKKLIVVIEGCEYIAIANKTGCDTVHIDGCRNPLHWSHVLSDTSWYWRLREDDDE
jgi:hypothetical protein